MFTGPLRPVSKQAQVYCAFIQYQFSLHSGTYCNLRCSVAVELLQATCLLQSCCRLLVWAVAMAQGTCSEVCDGQTADEAPSDYFEELLSRSWAVRQLQGCQAVAGLLIGAIAVGDHRGLGYDHLDDAAEATIGVHVIDYSTDCFNQTLFLGPCHRARRGLPLHHMLLQGSTSVVLKLAHKSVSMRPSA